MMFFYIFLLFLPSLCSTHKKHNVNNTVHIKSNLNKQLTDIHRNKNATSYSQRLRNKTTIRLTIFETSKLKFIDEGDYDSLNLYPTPGIISEVVKSTQPEMKNKSVYNFNISKTYFESDKNDSADIDHRRTCVSCNNLEYEMCNEPLNRIVPAATCDEGDSFCYSLHTPFGIVNRGCLSSYNILTTFVCTRSLCNHVSLSDLPYVFSSKQDWITNVLDLTRSMQLRNLQPDHDLECLHCELKFKRDAQEGVQINNAPCIEGLIGQVPIETCRSHQYCAVKASKKDNYIWRGCTDTPLYNHWWKICDYDSCNYDKIVSVYDVD